MEGSHFQHIFLFVFRQQYNNQEIGKVLIELFLPLYVHLPVSRDIQEFNKDNPCIPGKDSTKKTDYLLQIKVLSTQYQVQLQLKCHIFIILTFEHFLNNFQKRLILQHIQLKLNLDLCAMHRFNVNSLKEYSVHTKDGLT